MFSFYIGRKSKVLKWRDLTGPEKIKLFQNLHKIKELLKGLPIEEVQRIIDVLQEFYEMHTLLRSFDDFCNGGNADPRIRELKFRVKRWLEMFGGIYHHKNITPYMHLLVNHAPDLIERHGSFFIFSAQGLEKLNHLMTVDYLKSTNHWHGIQALDQLVRKQN